MKSNRRKYFNISKFSLIIPVYNVEQYLEQCLNSIVNQAVRDFEVICINDGSTDNSLEILNKYAKNDKRFIVVSQENQGQGVARNNALKMARGEYIVFVDPDDWIELNMLEDLLKAFEQTKAEVIHFNYRDYYEYSGEFNEHNTAQQFEEKFNYDLNRMPYYNWKNVKKNCLSNLALAVWKIAYSREFLERIQAVCAPTKHCEDHLFSIIVLLNAEKIYYLDKYLYTYRHREDSAVNIISDINFCIFENIQLLKTYLIEHNLYEELEDEFRQYQLTVMKWLHHKIPAGSEKRYNAICRELLTKEEYKSYKREFRRYSFWEYIFSLKNDQSKKHKVITILGVKIKIRRRKTVKY